MKYQIIPYKEWFIIKKSDDYLYWDGTEFTCAKSHAELFNNEKEALDALNDFLIED